MYSLGQLFDSYSCEYRDAAGQARRGISIEGAEEIASRLGCSRREAEIAALEAGIWPLRFDRNRGTLGIVGQVRLLKSRASVVGLGGLGALVAELLARSGVGSLRLSDPDCYDETNLNRQMHCAEGNMGASKFEETRRRLWAIDGALSIEYCDAISDRDEGVQSLAGSDVVMDCLDTLGDRLTLAQVCRILGVPMVHAAIAGFSGQLSSIYPDEDTLKILYGEPCEDRNRGIEVETGNLGPTAAALASLQAAEAIKIISGIGDPVRGGVLLVDLYGGRFERVDLS